MLLKFLSKMVVGLVEVFSNESLILFPSFISKCVLDFIGFENVAADGENDPFLILSSNEF